MTTWKWLTNEQKAAVVADLQAGRPVKEIAQEYGRSEDGIRYVARRAGVPPRGPGIRPPEQFVELGQVFSRLTVILSHVPGPGNRALCRCECGEVHSIRIQFLLAGLTQSCGCLKREKCAERIGQVKKTHGMTKHPFYGRWVSMMRRCFDPACDEYHNYGGRGITVDLSLQWPPDFIAYLEEIEVPAGLVGNPDTIRCRDLTPAQREKLLEPRKFSIDRINNDGNYERGNLRWADWKIQNNNQRRSRKVA